ncbi:MAG TPA: adenylate/guanylate cyclase domain-containing protein [Spirochaetia bacterium]|nr:adenylate/guanylate cyclase domain-containing protein [Spirochaetia bacterium]
MATKLVTQVLSPNIRLLITKGTDQGRVYETNRYPFIIGRDASTDFQIKGDNNISRQHVKVNVDEDGGVWIEDLGSTNGCFVNNVRINKRTELSNGCTIIIGNTWLKFIVYSAALSDIVGGTQFKTMDTSTFFREAKKPETILILDLHESSQLADRYGDEMALLITENLNEIALPVFNKYKAEYYKGTGDGFLATFPKPAAGLDAAVLILEKAVKLSAGKKNQRALHVRLCLNYGQCIIEPNGDRHGNAVNVAFRAEGVKFKDMKKDKDAITQKKFPEKDRIVVTAEFLEQLPAVKRKSFAMLGNFKLKGIRGLHTLHTLKVKK